LGKASIKRSSDQKTASKEGKARKRNAKGLGGKLAWENFNIKKGDRPNPASGTHTQKRVKGNKGTGGKIGGFVDS